MIETNVADGIKLLLRLPPSLHRVLVKFAKSETRSLNGQILHMLRQGLPEELKRELEAAEE